MDFDVERSPRYRLGVLSRLWANAAERDYQRAFGVGLSEWWILAIVGAEQPISAGMIADRGFLKKAHISRLVAALVARGLLVTTVDRQDARRNWLTLTPAGDALSERIARASRQRDEAFLDVLSPEEKRSFDGLIAKLTASIRATKRPD